jgi:6-phosphogluconolactonase
MIEKTLFARGKPDLHRFLRFRTELNDPVATADEFEREWRDFGIDKLDIAFLGIGDDGHTASLFPGTTALNVDDRIATAVHVPKLNAWRVTLTKTVIREAALRIVIAAGASKKPILEEVRAGADYPIAIVTRGVETWWFVDCTAVPQQDAPFDKV